MCSTTTNVIRYFGTFSIISPLVTGNSVVPSGPESPRLPHSRNGNGTNRLSIILHVPPFSLLSSVCLIIGWFRWSVGVGLLAGQPSIYQIPRIRSPNVGRQSHSRANHCAQTIHWFCKHTHTERISIQWPRSNSLSSRPIVVAGQGCRGETLLKVQPTRIKLWSKCRWWWGAGGGSGRFWQIRLRTFGPNLKLLPSSSSYRVPGHSNGIRSPPSTSLLRVILSENKKITLCKLLTRSM